MTAATRDFWAGRRVLLTGHTGFKGAWLLALLERFGARVCGVSLPEPVSEPSLYAPLFGGSDRRERGLARDLRFDLADRARLEAALAEFAPEVVFHLAAQALVRPSYAAPQETFLANTVGTLNLLEAIRKQPSVRAVVCATTDKVYRQDGVARPAFAEDDPLGGHDPYSASKAAAEMIAASYRESFFAAAGVGLATARAGNVIGGGDWARDRIVPDLARAAAAGTAAALRHSSHVRPWQHVLDALAGYLLLARRLLDDPGQYSGAWNFSADEENVRTVRDLAARFYATLGRGDFTTASEAGAPHEAAAIRLNAGKARAKLGWRGRWGFEEAVDRTARWYEGWRRGESPRDLVARDIDAFFGPDAEGDAS